MSLGIAAARNLTTTTKTVPQMQNISSRWLLRTLPWAEVGGGTYRVNRRLVYAVGDGRVSFVQEGAEARVVPAELGELPLLRGFDEADALQALAERFQQQEFQPGQVIVEAGRPAATSTSSRTARWSASAPASTARRPGSGCSPTAGTSASGWSARTPATGTSQPAR